MGRVKHRSMVTRGFAEEHLVVVSTRQVVEWDFDLYFNDDLQVNVNGHYVELGELQGQSDWI